MKKTILFLLSVVFLNGCSGSASDNLQLTPQAGVVPNSDVNVPVDTLKEPVAVPGSDPTVLEQKDGLLDAKPL